jgi:uncharacterized protein YqcC (DUF446 family)
MSRSSSLAILLNRLEKSLSDRSLWDVQRPSEKALSSTEPFCVDTLTLPQWLQFIFIPRLRSLIAEGQALPERCEVLPMAEEYFKVLTLDSAPVLKAISLIDDCLTIK